MSTQTYYHAIEFITGKCVGCMKCMKTCPTAAIRVRDGKASKISERCTDCGDCILACPNDAIRSLTDELLSKDRFDYTVAIPSTVLHGQFHMNTIPEYVLYGLLETGFDEVVDITDACERTVYANYYYVKEHSGKRPILSVTCPAVVRLIQVKYPVLIDSMIGIEVPRELAAAEARIRISKEKGIPPDRIGILYITPCPAKLSSIKQPAEKKKSSLDGCIAISDIYNSLYRTLMAKGSEDWKEKVDPRWAPSQYSLRWGTVVGMVATFKDLKWLSLSGTRNIIAILDDIEAGKVRDVDFIECLSCLGGCTGGSLTVENTYVARSRLLRFGQDYRKLISQKKEALFKKAYEDGYYNIKSEIRPRKSGGKINILDAVARLRKKEALLGSLPGINCGLCGSPSCVEFAGDVSEGDVDAGACVFLSKKRWDKLYEYYNRSKKRP